MRFQLLEWQLLIGGCLLGLLAGCQGQRMAPESVSVHESCTDKPSKRQSSATGITPVVSNSNPELGEWIIGLDADMSSGSAISGEAIRRGIELALENINANGGLLGRSVKLEVRDHRGNPDRGVHNLMEFSRMKNLLAVVGGVHTPVALKQLPLIHEKEIIYLGPWAAGTNVVSNGYNPNFVFRVSVRDEYAGGFLVDCACERQLEKMGLLLERTGWGRSNEKAILNALSRKGLDAVGVEWFNWGEKKMETQLTNLIENGADVILLVSNPLEGAEVVQTMAAIPKSRRVSIISHWGISAGNFFEVAGNSLDDVDVSFIQSFSFLSSNLSPKARTLASRYTQKFEDAETARDIFAPVGTAHAYEVVMMLFQAVCNAGTGDSVQVRGALENLKYYSGVIRVYDPPFHPSHHDALTINDFILARFAPDGAIVPVGE